MVETIETFVLVNLEYGRRFIQPRLALLVAAVCLSTASCHRAGTRAPSYPGARTIPLADIAFDDGDTFRVQDKPIRVLGIDTPEIAHPEFGMDTAQPFGPAAAESTRAWITRARRIELVPGGWGRYHRRLAHVFLDGELLAVRLLRAGLAYETVTHYGDNGFPDLAQRILDTARTSPRPRFQAPYKWKQKHRKKR